LITTNVVDFEMFFDHDEGLGALFFALQILYSQEQNQPFRTSKHTLLKRLALLSGKQKQNLIIY
jgi:hypothetical protein